MNRKEAQRLLDRHFEARWGKGDHRLYYKDNTFVIGLAVCSRSNGKELPRSISRKIQQLCK